MIDPNTNVTGRTRLFASVEAFDHERKAWVTSSSLADAAELSADALVQSAIDAGYDDIRLALHVTGSREGQLR